MPPSVHGVTCLVSAAECSVSLWCLTGQFSLQRSYPYVSVMLGNGTLSYDHDRDGRSTELGGCTALVRNAIYDTFLLIRYSRNRLKACLYLSISTSRRISTRLVYSYSSFQYTSLEKIIIFFSLVLLPSWRWMWMGRRNGKNVLTSQDCIYLQDTSLVPRQPPVIFQVWHVNLCQFATSAGSDRSLHIIPTDFHAVLDNHDIISLKLYQLTVQRNAEAEEEEEEEVTIPRVDNINLFQGKNHPIPIHLFDKADVIID